MKMTPERLAALTANVPPLADFTRYGAIILVVAPSFKAQYELVMILDGLTDLNRRLGPGVDAQPAPEPLRHYEIRAEGAVIVSASY